MTAIIWQCNIWVMWGVRDETAEWHALIRTVITYLQFWFHSPWQITATRNGMNKIGVEPMLSVLTEWQFWRIYVQFSGYFRRFRWNWSLFHQNFFFEYAYSYKWRAKLCICLNHKMYLTFWILFCNVMGIDIKLIKAWQFMPAFKTLLEITFMLSKRCLLVVKIPFVH